MVRLKSLFWKKLKYYHIYHDRLEDNLLILLIPIQI